MQKKSSKIYNGNKGMSYVELIVVLSIFSVISAVAIFNYGDFQSKVDVKNLSSEIALRIVGAQRDALSGKLPPNGAPLNWRPAYGVHFAPNKDTKSFFYFADLSNDDPPQFEGVDCHGECLDKILINKGETIPLTDGLTIFDGAGNPTVVSDLTITFTRPDSSAVMVSGGNVLDVSHAEIKIVSPRGKAGFIKVYPSGRIQVD